MAKILLVEDNVHLLDDIKLELEMNGYSVMEAADGQAALDLLQALDTPPDIIISDLIMPNMDGYELLQEVRTYEQWAEIPFIFLTARDSNKNIRTSKQLGADDYLTKPFNPEDLLLTIENRLNRVLQMRQGASRQLAGTRRQLLNMISHELRTPLSALIGGSELLAQSLADVPDTSVQRMLNLLLSGTNRLNRVVENVVRMVQIDSGYLEEKMSAEGQHHEMKSIVQNAIEALQAEANFFERNLRIEVTQPDKDLYVLGIFDYLYLMVSELLRNAYTFSPIGGTIKIDIKAMVDHIIIEIEDEGPGMAPEELEMAWERFGQVRREHQEQQGVGLGLSLVRESVTIHGGECRLELANTGGLKAIISLPIAASVD